MPEIRIKESEIARQKITPQDNNGSWAKWLLLILGDIALSLATWYIGGYAGAIALSLQVTTESVNIGLQLSRIGLELAYNLGMDYENLTHRDGSLNWNTLFLRTIFVLGVEGLPQLTQNIRWLRQVKNLDRELIKNGVDKQLRNTIKIYSKDFALINQTKKLDQIGAVVFESDRLILESATSTFGINGVLNPLVQGYQSRNITTQIKKLFGHNVAKQYEKEIFKQQVSAIRKSIMSWNQHLDQVIEKVALFKSLKYTPNYVKDKIFNNSTIKYIGFEEVNGISRINLFLSVMNKWIAGLRYLNPYIATRKLAGGIIKGINRALNPKRVQNVEKLLGNTLDQTRESIKVSTRIPLKFESNPAVASKARVSFTSDLLERHGKLLIKHFQLIPVESSWILGYRIITLEIGFCLHIFFKPEQTASKINDFKGKAPIVTHPMSLDELIAWVNAPSYGRFYLDNFAYALDWHKYGILLTVGIGVAPYKIQSTLWSAMRTKRIVTQSYNSIKRIEIWTNLEWDNIIRKQLATVLAKSSTRAITKFAGYANPFLNGLIRGKGFWDMAKELAGRRAGVYVRRVRRRHHKIGVSDITPSKITKHSKSKYHTYKRFKY